VRVRKLLVILPLLVVLSAILIGCADYVPIPEDDSPPTIPTEEAYDDLLPTPGGPAYRGNVKNWEGDTRTWPPVETVVIKLDSVSLRYRNDIETGVGETRNNIFTLYREDEFWYAHRYLGMPGDFQLPCLELYAVSIPQGMELSQCIGAGPPGALFSVLFIEISLNTAPGQYRLEIGLNVRGRDYGTVPCIIEVVE
jgi:hypothetical protein